MNDSTLSHFRSIAAAMQSEPIDWQWIGPHMSQRMFGITERQAREYAERHGGSATPMDGVILCECGERAEEDETLCVRCLYNFDPSDAQLSSSGVVIPDGPFAENH